MTEPSPSPAHRRALRALRALPWSVGLAAVVALLVFSNRQELGRHLLQLLLVWIPIALLLHLPSLRRRWRQLLLALGGLALALLALAAVGPLLVARFAMPLYNMDIDHRPKPAEGRFNIDGVAPDQPPESYQPDEFVIVFLGDSFTQGFELEDPPGGFPFLVEATLKRRHPELNLRVANFGWVSSSPVLQARQLRDIGAAYHPDLVVQCLDMTDFGNDLSYARQLEDAGMDIDLDLSIFDVAEVWLSWTLGLSDLRGWLRARLAFAPQQAQPPVNAADLPPFFPLLQPLEQSEAALAETWAWILATRDVARDLDADYALVVLPRYQQFDPTQCPGDWEGPEQLPADSPHLLEPFRWAEQRRQQAAFPVWPLLEAFQQAPARPLVFDHDPHYNPAGHRVAAEAIAERIEAAGLLEAR